MKTEDDIYFLSIWIVIYSYLYIFNIVPYNPIILLYIAILYSLLNTIYIIYKYNENTLLYYYIFINILLKIPPFLLIYNNKVSHNDKIFTTIFIIVYLIFIAFTGKNTICIYKNNTDFIINKNNVIKEINYINSF